MGFGLFATMKEFDLAKLFVGYADYSYTSIFRQTVFHSFDMHIGILATGTMTYVNRKLKYGKAVFQKAFAKFGVLFADIVCCQSDMLEVLTALEEVIGRYVMDGRTVRLGYLVLFIPQLLSKAVASPDEVDVNSIKRFGCRFFPSTEFRRNLAKASFIESDMSVKGLVSEE